MNTPRRRFTLAAVAGALAALPVELALLCGGSSRLLGYEPLGDVYDAQARSLLDGRWDVPADVIRIEAFVVDSRSYAYFGPVPALLRMPVVAVTDGLDGRLTRLSLLLAWATTVALATRFLWIARGRPGRRRPVARREAVAVAAFAFVVGAGSSVAYLASRPSVFHEAIAWGVALGLAGLDRVLAWRARPTTARLAVATLAATAALLTRASVGAAPAVALGVYVAIDVVRRAGLRKVVPTVLALVVPAAAYVAVNQAKFGTLVTVPFERHRVTTVNEHRQDVLAANGGTIQGPQFLPTTVLHYVRPDAIRFDSSFPWVDFPPPATVVGGVLMDDVDAASSVPSAMPALTVLAIAGATAMARRRSPLRVPAFAATACLGVTLAIGFVAHRYTADAVPALVVAGAAGVYALEPWNRRPVAAALGVLAIASVATTAALTIQFGSHYGFLTAPSVRADLARSQLALPAGTPRYVRSDSLPAVAPDRTFLVVGDCAGLYRSDGEAWQPVEPVGRRRVALAPSARRLPGGITVVGRGGERVLRVAKESGRPVPADAVLDLVVDHLTGVVEVRHRGDQVLVALTIPQPLPDAEPSALCRRVVREGQPAARSS